MRTVTGALLSVALTGALMWFAGSAVAATTRTIEVGSAPAVPAGSHDLGRLEAASTLSVVVALAPRDPAALNAYALGVSTPGSLEYHHYLTVSEFAQRFGPSAATVSAVEGSLRALGLHPGALSANHLSLPVRAPAGALARAFSTSFERYRLRTGASAFANTTAPRLAASVAGHVEAIVGLQSLTRRHPEALRRMRRSAASPLSPLVTGAGGPSPCPTAANVAATPPVSYTADQIAAAYGVEAMYQTGDFGAGQTIAVYELEGNLPSDISAFRSCYQITPAISYQQIDGGAGAPDVTNGDGLETELDVENIIGLAPEASVIVYQGPNTGAGAYDTYNAIVSDDTASVISTSWGVCEAQLSTSDANAESTLFQEAAVQGQSVVAASGDYGVQDCFDPLPVPDTTPSVDDPASQPFVTGAGGTSLTLSPSRSESVWNSGVGAGGGGDSALWPMPSYQSSAATSVGVINPGSSSVPCGAASGACREVPDVSLDADPDTGYLVYYDGNGQMTDGAAWGAAGGTSGAAPTFAAILALANASTTCAGARVGFVNPAMYRAASANYANAFNDVFGGNNDWLGTNNGHFVAFHGFDEASGLGSPVASVLSPSLCTDRLVVSAPANQATLAGRAAILQLQSTDVAGLGVTYSTNGLPPGLSVNRTSGLISGTPTTAGTYHVRAIATDTQATTGSATFTWTVTAAALSLTAPGDQKGKLGGTAALQLHASDNNGAAIRYGATGLPRGLSLSATTGRISGRLTHSGTASVTVTASATGAAVASRSFKWRVSGPPSYSRASLGGLTRRQPTLKLRVSAGIDSPSLHSISLALPTGLSFSGRSLRAHRGLGVTGSHGQRLGYSVTIAGGKLVITLKAAASQVRLALTPPALGVTRQVSRRTRSHAVGVLILSITVRDSAGLRTGLRVRVRPS